jgi:hypothetical protein
MFGVSFFLAAIISQVAGIADLGPFAVDGCQQPGDAVVRYGAVATVG